MFTIPDKVPVVLYVTKNTTIKGIRHYVSMQSVMDDFFSNTAEYEAALHVFGKVGCDVFCILGSTDLLKNLKGLSALFNTKEVFSLYIPESLWTAKIQEYTQNYSTGIGTRFKFTKVMLDVDRSVQGRRV